MPLVFVASSPAISLRIVRRHLMLKEKQDGELLERTVEINTQDEF